MKVPQDQEMFNDVAGAVSPQSAAGGCRRSLRGQLTRLKGGLSGGVAAVDAPSAPQADAGDGPVAEREHRLLSLHESVAFMRGGRIAHDVFEAMLAGATEDEVREQVALGVQRCGDRSSAHAFHALEALRQFLRGDACWGTDRVAVAGTPRPKDW